MKLVALITLSLAFSAAHAQPQREDQTNQQNIQRAMDREMHVIDSAAVATCSALYPDLAPEIDKQWRKNLAALPPDLIAYRKTDAFAKASATYQQEQTLEASKPANQKAFQATCKAMAGQ